ncbi:hypothetical protein PBV88_16385, partial [Streptomyces sp. T21Q-yed]|nr:hypothetical protein [Streptomyces sp. T21Q-yed]
APFTGARPLRRSRESLPRAWQHLPLRKSVIRAAAATELALALGRGEEVPQVGLEIATTLTVRESTAPPKEE